MRLVWKLLRQHISISQFVGFTFANLLGIFIVLFAYQFYRDVLPAFTQEDSFMKADYKIVSKKIGTSTTLSGRTNTFKEKEIADLCDQSFVNAAGKFVSANYKVEASMGVNGTNILNSEIFFESIPDRFVDISSDEWHYKEGESVVPVILPRSYLTMYNFGFAQSHAMPQISDGLAGMIDLAVFINANGHHDKYKCKVIGFSNRFSSILVPESFIEWSNAYYAPSSDNEVTRMIVEVNDPTDEKVSQYLDDNGLELENGNANLDKMASFLRLIVAIVIIIGLVISALSFYILMLSIYLLVQKNTYKLQNLLLIGYSPNEVARPYILLSIMLNAFVLVVALVMLVVVRGYYIGNLDMLLNEAPSGSFLPTAILGLSILVLVSVINVVVIRRKILSLWRNKE